MPNGCPSEPITKPSGMQVEQVTRAHYEAQVQNYTCVFESPAFNELNADKCDELVYLIFADKKQHFGLIGGLKTDGILSVPFSAPYSLITAIKKRNTARDYDAAAQALIRFCLQKGFAGIDLVLPPRFYHETMVASWEQALHVHGFAVRYLDLNHFYRLTDYTDDYIERGHIKVRQKIKRALRAGLEFARVDSSEDMAAAYAIIKDNRESKGYPLRMRYEDIQRTVTLFPADFFIVSDPAGQGLAACIAFHVASGIVQIIYWGNRVGTEEFCPMNYLAYRLFDTCHKRGIRIVDLGPSSEGGVPNHGLCDFKQSLGCETTTKVAYQYRF